MASYLSRFFNFIADGIDYIALFYFAFSLFYTQKFDYLEFVLIFFLVVIRIVARLFELFSKES